MFMNAGWLGGMLYLLICAGTLVLGFRHALKPTKTQLLFLIVYAALAGNIIEGYLIDTDHWRHFYLLMGVVWGLMASDTRVKRKARIVRDVRPVLMRAGADRAAIKARRPYRRTRAERVMLPDMLRRRIRARRHRTAPPGPHRQRQLLN